MEKQAATELARRLLEQIGGNPAVQDVQPQLLNPHAGDGVGWGVRVYRTDQEIDVYGSEKSGYSTMTGTGGFRSIENLVGEIILGPGTPTPIDDETSPPDDADLITRLGVVAGRLQGALREVTEIRDELALRRSRR